MNKKSQFIFKASLLAGTIFLGAGSMLFLCVFLFAGPVEWVHTDLSYSRKLALNSVFCLLFFFQHSLMIRRFFKKRFEAWFPRHYYGAFYSMTSGAVLYVLIIFWQPVGPVFLDLPHWIRWFLNILFFSTGIIFIFSAKALPGLDALGIGPLFPKGPNQGFPLSQDLVIKGPYRWVRHPLYLCFIIAAWSTPHITADRLLFNILWSIWIYLAIHLEERDLVLAFGEPYRHYQQTVPMLFPKSLRPCA